MRKFSMLTVAALALVVYACNKDRKISPDPPLDTYNSMDEVFNALNSQPKTVTIDAGTTNTFFGNSGTRYTLYANTLVKADGTPVTGNVQVKVTEWLGRGDMIFGRMLPVSNGQALVSGGELEIRVTQDGQELYLEPDAFFTADVPQGGEPEQGMLLYRGDAAQDSAGMNNVNWRQAKSNNPERSIILYHSVDSLRMISDSFNWLNIDKLGEWPLKHLAVNVSVQGATLGEDDYLMGYVLIDGRRSLVYIPESGTAVLSSNNIPAVPVHLAVSALVGNKFYAAVVPVAPGAETADIVLSQKSATDFKTEVNNLQ